MILSDNIFRDFSTSFIVKKVSILAINVNSNQTNIDFLAQLVRGDCSSHFQINLPPFSGIPLPKNPGYLPLYQLIRITKLLADSFDQVENDVQPQSFKVLQNYLQETVKRKLYVMYQMFSSQIDEKLILRKVTGTGRNM